MAGNCQAKPEQSCSDPPKDSCATKPDRACKAVLKKVELSEDKDCGCNAKLTAECSTDGYKMLFRKFGSRGRRRLTLELDNGIRIVIRLPEECGKTTVECVHPAA